MECNFNGHYLQIETSAWFSQTRLQMDAKILLNYNFININNVVILLYHEPIIVYCIES